jgi:hypothetical protein
VEARPLAESGTLVLTGGVRTGSTGRTVFGSGAKDEPLATEAIPGCPGLAFSPAPVRMRDALESVPADELVLARKFVELPRRLMDIAPALEPLNPLPWLLSAAPPPNPAPPPRAAAGVPASISAQAVAASAIEGENIRDMSNSFSGFDLVAPPIRNPETAAEKPPFRWLRKLRAEPALILSHAAQRRVTIRALRREDRVRPCP